MTAKIDLLGVAPPPQTSRRNFIFGAGAAGLTLVLLHAGPDARATPLVLAAGWGSFFRGLLRFAKQVGMSALSLTLAHYLDRLDPGVGREVSGSIEGLGSRGYGAEGEPGAGRVIAGDSTMCTCLVSPANVREGRLDKAALVPFYDTHPRATTRVGSVLSTPTVAAMPYVAEDLEQLGFGTDERFGLLVPTLAQRNSYNMENLPDTYLTRDGGFEAGYHPYDGNFGSGDLRVRVTRKRPGKSERLEPLLERSYGLDFGV